MVQAPQVSQQAAGSGASAALPAEAPRAAPGPAAPSLVPVVFDAPALVEQVKPTVVNITTTRQVRLPSFDSEGSNPFDFYFGPRGSDELRRPFRASGAGSGFLIDASGLVVTNDHVVAEADEVRVRLADEREFLADVIGRDPKLDLALIQLRDARNLPRARLGSSEQLRVGEHVLAVGNPFGLGHTVTIGIVSAKARAIGAGPYDDFIQTDASINPGNSGGPLFNGRGEVVGINTAIRPGANGIGFAIPVDALKDILPQLRSKGYVERGKLGVAFQPVTSALAAALVLPSPQGGLVAEVEPGAAAARAGIRPGDVIIAVNGTSIRHADELPRMVARHAPGSQVTITVLRGKQRLDLATTLDALPRDHERAVSRPGRAEPEEKAGQVGRIGVRASNAPAGGVRVDDVLDESRAGELERGDVILELNGKPIKNADELRAAITKAQPGTTALFKVRRGQVTRFAAVPLGPLTPTQSP